MFQGFFAQDPLPCLPSEMKMPPEGSGMKELGVRRDKFNERRPKRSGFSGQGVIGHSFGEGCDRLGSHLGSRFEA